ncbi:PIN domain-containing protein [Enterobacter cloacae complex sp. ECC445]|uniref:PIN domain-containing protein n=1 Tax=Enterobacter cloacae complex sp. ECC445 TaxID=2913213 RepID=UPI001F310210|nr:PIN domain-containing protein [Enterobacter cloacae complex sp. ECC445]MCG0456867.1 PIN domain-containing protein [Enterobacter cloacae complex sp. ECC445]
MPNISIDDLKRLISNREIGAITLDTSIYIHHHYGFEVGILSKLSQFKNTEIKFIVVDMIQHETLSHLIEEAKKNKAETKNSLKVIGNSWGVTPQRRQELMDELFTSNEDEISKARFDDFKKKAGAREIKCAELSSLSKVIDLYFNKIAPFAIKKDKKNEFPDALALSALEVWAESNNTKILAVSKDNDWKEFCETSPLLYFIDELSNALTALHSNASVNIINALKTINIDELNKEIIESIPHQLYNLTVDVEASSSFYYDVESSELTMVDDQQQPINDFEKFLSTLSIIDTEEESFSVQYTVNCNVDIETTLDFNTWDGIDKEFIGMGGGIFNNSEDIDIDIIINFNRDGNDIEIDSIEVISSSITIDLGEVGPDWMNDPDYYD